MVTERFGPISRIGLLADTHDDKVDWPLIQRAVADALGPVDLVVVCGDLMTPSVLDELEAIAPVRAVRGEMDPPAAPPRLIDGPLILETEAGRVAVCRAEPPSDSPVLADVGVVIYGSTHEAEVKVVDGRLYVNPGSPALAATRCVGVLDLSGPRPSAALITLAS